MTERLPNTGNMYEAGRDFYGRQIDAAAERLEASNGNDFEMLEAMDELEFAQLKLRQLNRREQILVKKHEQKEQPGS